MEAHITSLYKTYCNGSGCLKYIPFTSRVDCQYVASLANTCHAIHSTVIHTSSQLKTLTKLRRSSSVLSHFSEVSANANALYIRKLL